MPLDPALLAEVRAWLVKAARDLAAADYDLQATPPFLDDSVFHSQQACEKALKALLSWHGCAFRKTHNLVELGEACCARDQSLQPLLRQAAPLTEYAWKFRYPGEPEQPSGEEAQAASKTAREVFEAITSRLPAEVRP